MEIVIIISAISFAVAYICLTPKTRGEIAQKENPGYKSSLRHNGDRVSPEKVFKVLKENNIEPCFLASDLSKQNEPLSLVDTSVYTITPQDTKYSDIAKIDKKGNLVRKLVPSNQSNTEHQQD